MKPKTIKGYVVFCGDKPRLEKDRNFLRVVSVYPSVTKYLENSLDHGEQIIAVLITPLTRKESV